MKKIALGAVLALAVIAAGCGSGGGKALTKDEYAAKLNAICNEADKTFSEISNSDPFQSFKDKGDEVVDAAKKAANEFHDQKAPDELKSAAGTFNDSADEIVEDFENLNDAAKDDDRAKFNSTISKLQGHGMENDDAAKEIGATDCVGG